MGAGEGGNFGNTKGSRENKVTLPQNESQLKHIFGDRKGHLPDTPYNRKLLENVANDKSLYKGTDKYGNDWHIKENSKGNQIWVRSQNGTINEGGKNDIPREWNDYTGLNNPFKKQKRVR